MKVLVINSSPRANGNTSIALNEVIITLNENGIETELLNIGTDSIRGCIACKSCVKTGKCVFDDAVNDAKAKFKNCDGLLVGTPVYYASANATLIAFLDRLFTISDFDKTMKVGAGIAVARRGGISSTFDELNKYFTICGMPVVSSQYWNGVHGQIEGEAKLDAEGLQTMRTLGNNMAFLIKSIKLGIDKYGLPIKEEKIITNFIK
ncbi:MAG: flavodoxin family protein [Clostridia bacterium]|nr:flavodoxin family protein [Clostridia bacterium]